MHDAVNRIDVPARGLAVVPPPRGSEIPLGRNSISSRSEPPPRHRSEPPGNRAPRTLPPPVNPPRLVLDSLSMAPTMNFVERLGPTSVSVTIFGETGTGKDGVARLIHDRSLRANAPFVIFDCGAVAANLVESELLGHEKGSFTGAVTSYQGAFERAHGGTLFLDEIGELPLELQPRLLRALENRQIRRVGGTDSRLVDVRVIAATNRDLGEEVRAKRFREDLYFRLTGASIRLPSLRARKEDLPAICSALLADLDAPPAVHLTDAAVAALAEHDWPGNIRELKNVLSCALCVAPGDAIDAEHIQIHRRGPPAADTGALDLAGRSLVELERVAIEQTLRLHAGQKTKAAETLGIALSTLYEKLKRYGIS
jgi:DNA-binding NtrC family response regulator